MPEVPEATEVSRRRQETRTRLLDAAAEVFAEHGLQGASVEHICSRANFTRGAFYSNFSSKEELFTDLLHREYEQRAALVTMRASKLAEQLAAGLAEGATPITPETAAAYVSEFIAPSIGAPHWFTLETEFLLMSLRDPEGAVQFVDFGLLFRDELARVVEQLLHAAGRRFTIPVASALEALDGLYERAQRVSALDGANPPEGLGGLGERIAELLFAITTEE